jgi:hypothetical protein
VVQNTAPRHPLDGQPDSCIASYPATKPSPEIVPTHIRPCGWRTRSRILPDSRGTSRTAFHRYYWRGCLGDRRISVKCCWSLPFSYRQILLGASFFLKGVRFFVDCRHVRIDDAPTRGQWPHPIVGGTRIRQLIIRCTRLRRGQKVLFVVVGNKLVLSAAGAGNPSDTQNKLRIRAGRTIGHGHAFQVACRMSIGPGVAP